MASHKASSINASGSKPSSSSKEPPWSVQSVLSTLSPPLSSTHTPSSPLPFFHILERLKTTPREGWRRFAIPNHMYRMSILTLLAPAPLRTRLDIPRCTSMALIHDMAESLVGDITPIDNVPKDEKNRREASTMNFLTSQLLSPSAGVGTSTGDDIRALWQEYEDGETLEAKFVHDVDKFELLLQMIEYERRGGGNVDLKEFGRVSKGLMLPEVIAWCDEVFDEREEFWRSVGKPLKKGWRKFEGI